MIELTAEAVEALEELASKTVVPKLADTGDTGSIQIYVDTGAQGERIHKVLDVEAIEAKYRDHPIRAKGEILLRNEQAFVRYVNDHKDPLSTLLLGDDKRVVAIFNHHDRWLDSVTLPDGTPIEADGPLDRHEAGWSDYRATLELKVTPSWSAWAGLAVSGYMPQEDFADFLEVNAQDVNDPDGARLLELVSNLRLSSQSTLESSYRAANGGVVFKFVENFVAMGGAGDESGQIDFPDRFRLQLAVFDGGEELSVPVLLRYQVKNQKLGFKIVFTGEANRIFDDAFDSMCEVIAAGTDLPVLRGRLA